MHFVAMLAHQFPFPVYYDVLQTLSSALVAILVVGVSLLLLHFTVRTPLILVAAGLILGIGILSMHYIGMMGIRGAEPFFSTGSSLLSVAVAALMGIAAIRVAYGRRSKQNIVFGSLLMGFSVVIVHFASMNGTQFMRRADFVPESAVLATGTLAVIVTVAAFVICGSFLLAATTFLTSTAVPDSKVLGQPELPPELSLPSRLVSENAAELIQQQPVFNSDTGPEDSGPEDLGDEPLSVKIPFERDKKTGFAMSDDIAAIRADGHYSHLYTRDGIRFCPWSITEAETHLADSGFHRTHRSYLVNIAAVSGFEKRRETGVCLFENYPQITTVPVSRNRVIGLLDVLDVRVL